MRDLHLGAWWNAASLPNAFIAQLSFVPLALDETDDPWRAALLMLLPACLLTTKLVISQAYKMVSASVALGQPGWRLLQRCDESQRAATMEAEAFQPAAQEGGGMPSTPLPPATP